MTNGLAGPRPILLLDREVDVGIRVGLPTLAFQDPTGLTAAAGVTAARHRIAEWGVGVLRIFFEVSHVLKTLLIAQFHAAQIEHGVLHRYSDLLSFAGLL